MWWGEGGSSPLAGAYGTHTGLGVAGTHKGTVGRHAGVAPEPLLEPAGTRLVLEGGLACCIPTSVNKE